MSFNFDPNKVKKEDASSGGRRGWNQHDEGFDQNRGYQHGQDENMQGPYAQYQHIQHQAMYQQYTQQQQQQYVQQQRYAQTFNRQCTPQWGASQGSYPMGRGYGMNRMWNHYGMHRGTSYGPNEEPWIEEPWIAQRKIKQEDRVFENQNAQQKVKQENCAFQNQNVQGKVKQENCALENQNAQNKVKLENCALENGNLPGTGKTENCTFQNDSTDGPAWDVMTTNTMPSKSDENVAPGTEVPGDGNARGKAKKKNRKEIKAEKWRELKKKRAAEKKEWRKEMMAKSKKARLEPGDEDSFLSLSDNDSDSCGQSQGANNNNYSQGLNQPWKYLPWYLYPVNTCWECRMRIKGDWKKHLETRHQGNKGARLSMEINHGNKHVRISSEIMQEWVLLVNGLLWTICRIRNLNNLNELLQYALEDNLVGKSLSRLEINMMKFYEKANGIESTGPLYSAQPPNCVAALRCGVIIRGLVDDMTPEEVAEVHSEKMMDFQGRIVTNPKEDSALPGLTDIYPAGADAHLNLDRLFLRTGKKTYKDAVTRLPEPRSVVMDLVIGSFSFPEQWPEMRAISELTLQEPRLKVAIGWGPLWPRIPEKYLLEKFHQLLLQRNVVAAGHFGLYYTYDTNDNDRLVQRTLLEKVLPIVAQTRLPVIIQYRGNGNEVLGHCFQILKKHLPPNYPVYISDFSGGRKVYLKWLKHFPDCAFGISPIILEEGKQNRELEGVIETMNDWQLLLETNAPNATPKRYIREGLVAHQDLLADIAEKVAQIRMSHRTIVMNTALKSARDFFRI